TIAHHQEVGRDILSPFYVGLQMVKLKMTRISRIPLSLIPSTVLTRILISFQSGRTLSVWDMPVMGRLLSVVDKHVDTHGKVWAPGGLGNYRPTFLRALLS